LLAEDKEKIHEHFLNILGTCLKKTNVEHDNYLYVRNLVRAWCERNRRMFDGMERTVGQVVAGV
jgi:hypothetical protein